MVALLFSRRAVSTSRAIASSVLVVSLAGACAPFGVKDASAETTEAGTCSPDLSTDSDNCGSCGNKCAAGSVCEASACRLGCPDRVMFVSVEGNDGNDGCSQSAPLRTLSGAIALAATRRLERHELHVCRGTYEEDGLELDYPVSIRGGYNCASWTRGDRFGKAGKFDDINTTKLSLPPTATSTMTLTVTGTAITSDVLLDGLTVEGRGAGTDGSIALVVKDGASPTLTELAIRGGKTSASGTGSMAISFRSGARPTLKDSLVHGGSGTGNIGSVGVRVDAAQALLQGNVIDAGDGTGSGSGAIAIHVAGKDGTGAAKQVRSLAHGTRRASDARMSRVPKGSASAPTGCAPSTTAATLLQKSTFTGARAPPRFHSARRKRTAASRRSLLHSTTSARPLDFTARWR
ncbi:MAG TPA: DUF1565 domain-containing protein [Labilithrix sp.]|nr:DUF1565 domain-containing protein [Labilithrix sp.]